MRNWLRIISLVLCAALLAGAMAGCNKTGGNNQGGDKPGGSGDNKGGTNAEPVDDRPEYIWNGSYYSIDTSTIGKRSENDNFYLHDFRFVGGKFYLVGSVEHSEMTRDPDTGEEQYSYEEVQSLYSMDPDGKNLKKIGEIGRYGSSNNQTPDEDGWIRTVYPQSCTPTDEGGAWLIKETYAYKNPTIPDIEPYSDEWYMLRESENYSSIEYMKPDGTIEKAYKLNELFADEIGEMGYFYANKIDTDKDGNIYLFTGQRVFILDKDMNKLSTVESDQYLNQSVRLKDGSVAAVITEYGGGMVDGPILYRDGAVADRKVVTPGRPITPGGGEDTKTTKTVLPIDPKTGKLGEALNVPYETVYSQLYTGGGDYDVYAYMNTSVFGIKLGKGENMGTFEELFNLLNLDIDGSNLYVMAVQADGGVVGITSTYSEGDDGGESFETFKVEKVKSSTVPYKTVLTLATMDTWSIKNAILKFNRNSDKYRIQVADYSQYNTEEDYSAGNTKLTAELLAGKVPDLIYTIGMPIDHLGAKGYLENLWPFIDKDTELGGRSGLVQPVFNALQSRDGKLYQIVSSFYVQTMAGPSSMVGTKMGWTVQELLNAYRQLPEGATIADVGFTKSQMLDGICSLMLDGFVNWDAGKTDFDNADFIGLLEFVNTFPADFSWEEYYGEDYVYESQGQRFSRGGQLITELTVSNMLSWRATEVNLGGDLTFVGYPVASGVGSGFVLQGGYAMSSTCKNKDAAWSFLRTFLTKEYQQSQGSWTMPTNKAVFDQRIEEAKTPRYRQDEKGEYQLDENGQRIEIPRGYGDGYTDKDGNWINTPYYHLTDEQAQKIIDLVNATTHVMTYDEDVRGIIADECSGLFAGTRTAAQTAKMIQSRLNLYVGEQK